MDLMSNPSDAEFDAYWSEEAKNPHRNRIRIGRQYQATIQPLLKPGESDKRKLENLETLSWCPTKHSLSNDELDNYFAMAKALSLFARAMQDDEEASLMGDSSDSEDEELDSKLSNQKLIVEKTPKKLVSDVPTWHKKITSLEPCIRLDSACKDLSDFVTSHHPDEKDTGCNIPVPAEYSATCNEILNSKTANRDWSKTEAYTFAKALEVCGKNFGAIKKNWLPWKPVKSIIEFYYKGSDNDDPNDDEPGDLGKRRQFLSVNSTKSLMSTKPPASNNNNTNNIAARSNGSASNKDNEKEPEDYDTPTSSENASKLDMFNLILNGKEIRPLKAKPIIKTELVESSSSSTTSNLGSLKFYMDGQLVLKLNAKQQAETKTQWIESQDTPKILRPVKKGKHPQKALDIADSDKNKCIKSDDTEDCSMESSDTLSSESSESKSLPSPSSSTGTPRKAKVKVENNCFVPLPSPSATGLPGSGSSSKDTSRLVRSETVTECNRSTKPKFEFPNVKREHSHVLGKQYQAVDSDDSKPKRFKGHLPESPPISSSSEKWPADKYTIKVEKPRSDPGSRPSAPSQSSTGQAIQNPPPAHSKTGQTHAHSSPRLNMADYMSPPSKLHLPHELTKKKSSSSHHHHAAPVDLTRKSANLFTSGGSPRDSKSVPLMSGSLDLSKDRPSSKSVEKERSHSGHKSRPSSSGSTSQNSSGSKHHQDHKSFAGQSTQRTELEPMRRPTMDTNNSLPQTTSSAASDQMAFLQNYMPLYEQYYRYCSQVGRPPRESVSPNKTKSGTSSAPVVSNRTEQRLSPKLERVRRASGERCPP